LLPEPAALSASLPWSYRFPAWVFPVDWRFIIQVWSKWLLISSAALRRFF
jgi:hypothetical protein